jgi:biopolymer transport protein ExbD
MGMSTGGKQGPKSEINVTPLVDVVLVLLIIFMVIIPMSQVGYDVNTPPKVETKVQVVDNDQLIVRLDANGAVFINKEQVAQAQFPGRFREVIKNRESKIVFFAADGEITYDHVADVMDMCREAGAKNIGIVFDDLKTTAGAATAVGLTQ